MSKYFLLAFSVVQRCSALFSVVQRCSALFSVVQRCSALFSVVQRCSALFSVVQRWLISSQFSNQAPFILSLPNIMGGLFVVQNLYQLQKGGAK
ncbi:hypothetical protein [Moraxella pluranimalium]|nr:hypothetical protein [Moraxella pluranimalium]